MIAARNAVSAAGVVSFERGITGNTMSGERTSARMSYSEAYRALGAAKKGVAAGAPAYSVYVNRPLGRVFAAAAYRAGMTPNAVTAASALCTAAGIALIAAAPVQPWLGVVVWLLL
ncbi:MAG: hypothetical protein ACTJHU_07145, partial [Mycetocola sp.]